MTVTVEHTFADPAAVERRLEEVEAELALTQNQLEAAALAWPRVKKARDRLHAEEFVKGEGTVAEREQRAALAVAEAVAEECETSEDGGEAEGRFLLLKMRAGLLGDRAAVGMAILKSQSRFGG